MARVHDKARMSVSGTPGTGNITLANALAGYQTFAASGVLNGETVTYGIADTGNVWEYGTGVYSSSGPTLVRSPINSSAGANTAATLSASAIVYITAIAEDLSFVAAMAALNAPLGALV